MPTQQFRALVPSGFKIVVCALIALALLGIYNWGIIVERFIRPIIFSETSSNYAMHEQISGFIDGTLSKNITLALVWALVGVGVYAIIWGIINASISARNAYVIKREFTNQASIYDTIEHHLARSSFMLGVVGLLLISVRYVLPWAFSQSSKALLDPSNLLVLGSACIGFLSMILIFHVISVLFGGVFSQK